MFSEILLFKKACTITNIQQTTRVDNYYKYTNNKACSIFQKKTALRTRESLGPIFEPFLSHFQDPFPDYSPFFDTQIAILISFSGSQLWMHFWETFGPFSDAKSPLKTGYYGVFENDPKNVKIRDLKNDPKWL